MLHEMLHEEKNDELLSIYSKSDKNKKNVARMLHEENTLKSNNIYYYSNKMLHENTKF